MILFFLGNSPFFLTFIQGLLLVPNGESIGYSMGDVNIYDQLPIGGNITKFNPLLAHRATASDTEKNITGHIQRPSHPWGVFFTILGTVLLDFDADACQSPARAFLLDVTLPEDHATGLSTFTIMAGLGGFMGSFVHISYQHF
jgi:solute carrier family 45, member 1/2/4